MTVPTSLEDVETVRFVLDYEESNRVRLNLMQLRLIHELKATGPQSVSELAQALRETDTGSGLRSHD